MAYVLDDAIAGGRPQKPVVPPAVKPQLKKLYRQGRTLFATSRSWLTRPGPVADNDMVTT